MQDEDNIQGLNINIKYYLAIIIKRRYLALSVAIAVLSIFTWGSFFWPKEYQASSTVRVEKSSFIDPLMKDVGVPRGTEDIAGSLRDSMMSRNVLEKVVKKLDLALASQNSSQHEGLINDMRRHLDISQGAPGDPKGNGVFMVTYKGKDPRMVRDTVNVLISEFVEENMGYRRSDAYDAYEFIKGQLLEYKNKLEESDKATREFRERNPQIIPQNETTITKDIEQLQSGRMEAEIKLKELTRKKENLQKQLSGEKELTVAFVSSESSPEGRLSYLNNQLMLLMGKFTENHPEIIKIEGEIEELKKEIAEAQTANTHGGGSGMSTMNPIYQRLREELASTDADLESLKARIQELSRQQQAGQVLLGRMPKEQEEWTKLERDRTVYQKIYDELLQKLESARVSTNLETSDKTGAIKVLDPATLPVLPVKPNRVTIIFLGVVLGIASGMGSVIGLEHRNRSFKDEADIESRLKLSVLGTIPSVATEEDKSVERNRDRRVFMVAAAYLGLIGLVLVNEFLYRYMGIKTIIF